jgi:hypothetical protein
MIQSITFSATTAAAGPIEYIPDQDPNIRVERDFPPGGLTCSGQIMKSDIFNVDMRMATPDGICYYQLTVNNLGHVPVYIAPLEHLLGDEFELTELSCDNMIPAHSSDLTIEFMIRLTDQSEPHTYYDDTKLIPNFEINPPACP